MKMVSAGNVIMLAGLTLWAAATTAPVSAEGNRYDFPRDYRSDISPVAAYRALQDDAAAVLIDVRTVGEYADGHAPGAYNIPFPRIAGADKDDPAFMAMSDAEFVAEVIARFPDRTAPIMTMCQSGGRSVLAANLLAKAGYTQVHSVWTGYLGKPLTDVKGAPLDVNGNGVVHDVTLGDDGKPVEDPGDMDGWAGFHQLPVSHVVDDERVLPRLRGLYPPAHE